MDEPSPESRIIVGHLIKISFSGEPIAALDQFLSISTASDRNAKTPANRSKKALDASPR